MEQQNIPPSKEENNPQNLSGIPIGVKLIAYFNLIFLGIFTLIGCITGFLNTNKIIEAYNKMTAEQHISATPMTLMQIKITLVAQCLLGIFYIITSIFLFRRSEIARKIVVYFSLFIAALLCLAALFVPAAIGQIIINAVYPGVCIWYLTSPKVINWFAPKQAQEDSAKCCT